MTIVVYEHVRRYSHLVFLYVTVTVVLSVGKEGNSIYDTNAYNNY